MTVSRSFFAPSVGTLLLPLLLLSCVLYYWAFAADLQSYQSKSGFIQYALNSYDHSIYLMRIDRLRNGYVLSYEFNNDFGIAALYVGLANVFPFLADPSYTLLALVFNCFTLVGCYALYADICRRLHLGTLGKLSFFANVYFIYFAQLINKDMLTVFAFLLAVRCGIRGRLWLLLALLPLFVLVRQQLAVFILIFAYLMASSRPGWRVIWLYVVTSLVAGLLSSFFTTIVGEESLGVGLSSRLVEFNLRYYVGYLLLNPLRVIQYVVEAYASFWFGTDTGGIDMAKVLRLPQLLVLLLFLKPLGSLVMHFRYWLKTPARPMVLAIVAYLFAWLMNPTINARYVMVITPVLVLFGLYARRRLGSPARRKPEEWALARTV